MFLRADASTQIGTGHLMRCLALAQAWQDAGGKAVFITACHNEVLLERLSKEFDVHVLAMQHPDNEDWASTRTILCTHPDAWVILDGYHFDDTYQQRVKESGHSLLVIDDMAHLKHYYADIVLNQNLHAEQLHYPVAPDTRLLLGTHYVLLRREFPLWKGWKRETPEVAQRVLVTMGGSDPDNVTLKAIRALQETEVAGLEATVVIGASNLHTEALEAAARHSSIPIHLTRNPQNMPDLMAWADVAISAGGSTVWELAFMGVPSIILSLADNQRPMAKALDTTGAALNLGRHAAVTSTDIRRALAQLLRAREKRSKMASLGQQLVDGRGVQRIISTMVAEVGGVHADSLSGKQPGGMAGT